MRNGVEVEEAGGCLARLRSAILQQYRKAAVRHSHTNGFRYLDQGHLLHSLHFVSQGLFLPPCVDRRASAASPGILTTKSSFTKVSRSFQIDMTIGFRDHSGLFLFFE